jgi:hypothetical protein
MLTPSRKAPTLLTKVVIVQVIVILAMDKSWCFANQPSLYEYKYNPPPHWYLHGVDGGHGEESPQSSKYTVIEKQIKMLNHA